jgi:hypothetical protein
MRLHLLKLRSVDVLFKYACGRCFTLSDAGSAVSARIGSTTQLGNEGNQPKMARKNNEARSLMSVEGAGAAALTHRRATRARATAKPDRADAKNHQPTVAKAPTCEHNEIAALAHSYWEARGRQGGSAEEDWFRAVEEVRRRQTSNS